MRTHIDNKAKALEQLFKAIVSSESNQVQDNISSRLRDLTLKQLDKEEHERLLGSFTHENMNARRNLITENHDDTFTWIFYPEYANNDTDNQV